MNDTRADIRTRLQEVFRAVLDDPELVVTDELTAADVDGWDSLSHASLMFSIESEFGVTFSDAEMTSFDNVGQLIDRVEEKLTRG